MKDPIERQAAIDAIGKASDELYENIKKGATFPQRQWFDGMAQAQSILENLPSAQPEWNNHTVACLLAELFDDTCACNYNGIDEWLPSKCELLDSCPNPAGVACWEQFLKHRMERRTDDSIPD